MMKRDPQGRWLCMHCSHALEADRSCRHCKGHQVGKAVTLMGYARADVVGADGSMAYRVNTDHACKGCGHFVCSCAKAKQVDGKLARRDPFNPVAFLQRLASDVMPRMDPVVRMSDARHALDVVVRCPRYDMTHAQRISMEFMRPEAEKHLRGLLMRQRMAIEDRNEENAQLAQRICNAAAKMVNDTNVEARTAILPAKLQPFDRMRITTLVGQVEVVVAAMGDSPAGSGYLTDLVPDHARTLLPGDALPHQAQLFRFTLSGEDSSCAGRERYEGAAHGYDPNRRTGRTTRMLEDAARVARSGSDVVVVMATASLCEYAMGLLVTLAPDTCDRRGRVVSYGRRFVRVMNAEHAQASDELRGFGGVVLFDHFQPHPEAFRGLARQTPERTGLVAEAEALRASIAAGQLVVKRPATDWGKLLGTSHAVDLQELQARYRDLIPEPDEQHAKHLKAHAAAVAAMDSDRAARATLESKFSDNRIRNAMAATRADLALEMAERGLVGPQALLDIMTHAPIRPEAWTREHQSGSFPLDWDSLPIAEPLRVPVAPNYKVGQVVTGTDRGNALSVGLWLRSQRYGREYKLHEGAILERKDQGSAWEDSAGFSGACVCIESEPDHESRESYERRTLTGRWAS